MSIAANTAITQTINNIAVLDEQYFVVTDQSANGCFVLPEPTLGEPTIFEGQCDESIAAVQNFDPVRVSFTIFPITKPMIHLLNFF